MKRAPGQQGTVLVAAVFLIIVLALLGAAMAMLSKVQSDTGLKTQLAANVYYGAKAGLEWGIRQAVSATASCVASTPFTLTEGALNGVSVTVTCSATSHGSAPPADQVYYLTSIATVGTLGGVNYAERRLEATVSNIP
ncbi:MAG: pilus assembly protein MshP [Pseudomonadota bacterium]